MKMIMIVLLMPLLISSRCSRVDVRLTCNQIRSAKIDSLPLCDISFQNNRCRCRCFNLTDYEVVNDNQCGQHFESGNYPLETCEGIAGFPIEQWPKEIRPNVLKLQNLFSNLCK